MPFAPVWNFDKIRAEAALCKSMTDFQRKHSGGYKYALRHKLLNKLREMFPSLNDRSRKLYRIRFSNGHEYIGITINIKERINQHKCGRLSEHFLSGYELEILRDGLCSKQAVILEDNEILKSKSTVGDMNLNRICGGSIGAVRKYWTKEKVLDVAKNYKYLTDFRENHEGAYDSAYTNGFLGEVKSHMIDKAIKWNEETILSEMKKYKTRSEFSKGNNSAYNAARKLNIWNKYSAVLYKPKSVKNV